MVGIAVFNVFLYPLQSYQMSDFWKSKGDSTLGAVLFIAGVIVVISILIILNIIKKKYNVPVLTGAVPAGSGTANGAAAGPRRFSSFALYKTAYSIGLNRQQTKMLDFVLKTDGVVDVEQSISSSDLLDQHFKRAYRAIEQNSRSDAETQEKLSVLFSTRNILEAGVDGGNIVSTHQVPNNTAAMLEVEQASYPVRVLSSKGEHLLVENPQNAAGSAVRLSKGAKITISFFTKSSKGFSFESRVADTTESKDGLALHLMHSSRIKRLSHRRFRRRQSVITANFYVVHALEDHRGKKRMVVDKRRLTGNIMDISIGGCSIKTNMPVNSGDRLKVEFTANNTAAATLGQVLRTNQSGTNSIMHVKFLKIPRNSMNAINTFVYEYAG
jgi:c-di-GMP-binding flagellar brake protein YcgR